jgi:hypothetical protein
MVESASIQESTTAYQPRTSNEEARKLFDAKSRHNCEPEVTADDYGLETITDTWQCETTRWSFQGYSD